MMQNILYLEGIVDDAGTTDDYLRSVITSDKIEFYEKFVDKVREFQEVRYVLSY